MNIGEKNGQWKGDKVGYKCLHKWVRRNKPIPSNCQSCGKIKTLEATNISGRYKRDLSDWKYLCRKCHMTHDNRIATWNSKRNQSIKAGIVKRNERGQYI